MAARMWRISKLFKSSKRKQIWMLRIAGEFASGSSWWVVSCRLTRPSMSFMCSNTWSLRRRSGNRYRPRPLTGKRNVHLNNKKDVAQLWWGGSVLPLLPGSLSTHSKESREQKSSEKQYRNNWRNERQHMLVLNRAWLKRRWRSERSIWEKKPYTNIRIQKLVHDAVPGKCNVIRNTRA